MLCFLLGLVTLSLVAVTDKPPYSALKLTMRFIECVVDAELSDFSELAFDPIEPRSIGRGPDQTNIVFSRPASYFWTLMR